MTDLSGMTPVEVDTLWAEAVEPANRLFEQGNAKSVVAARYRKAGGHYARQADRYSEEAKELYEKGRELRDRVQAPFLAEWNARGGWSRAYLVPDGHIHRSTACQSLYPTTVIRWVIELSGKSEDEIVEAAGMMACTFCYPSAPVEKLRAEHEAAKRAAQCPGSGTWDHDSSGLRFVQRRARCNHCGQVVSATSTGKLRAHKPKKEVAT